MDSPTEQRIQRRDGEHMLQFASLLRTPPKLRAKGIGEMELDNRSKPLAEGGYFEDHS
jgi:hypothetical protein